MAETFDALHVSSEDHYTHTPIAEPAARDWQPQTGSSSHERTTFISTDRDTSQQGQAYHEREQPGPGVQPKWPRPNRYIKATPGNSEELDSTYTIRRKDWQDFFKIGRVFSTLWTDSLGGNSNKIDPTFVSEVIYKQRVYSKIRRFIVVRVGERCVNCLPVTSYDGDGINKSGIRLGDHGFIYSRNKPNKIPGMCSTPLKLDLAKGAAHLKDPSLVNYGKVYTVETNVKVKNVGKLDGDSISVLRHYFRKVFNDDMDLAGMTPGAAEADLAFVGAAHGSFPPPLPPSSYPVTSAESAFTSTSTMSGYPPSSSTVYGSSHDPGFRSDQVGYGPGYYDPRASRVYDSSTSYPSGPQTTHGMNSTVYSGSGGYNANSMLAPNSYANAHVISPHNLSYTSRNTMDSSRMSQPASGFFPASTQNTYYQPHGAAPPLPPNSSAYQDDGYPQSYPPTGRGNDFEWHPDDYPPHGGYDPRYPESSRPLDPAHREEDIDLPGLEEARQDTERRRGSRSDRRHYK